MLEKLFNNKKFIFLFTFSIELLFYYIFEYLFIGGNYIIPDIGIAPIFGLMFGPVGALGQALATFVFELYEGMGLINSLLDTVITLFIGILTYKLWYSILKRKEINTPKFDSVYNLLKFLIIMFIVSVIYWAMINVSLEAHPTFNIVYTLTSRMNVFSYILNMFNFGILLGLFFISLFNILKIPLQSPGKWITPINIKYSYLIISFIILIIYPIITVTLHFDNSILDNIFFAIFSILAILFCFNKFDVNIKIKRTNYSIIEEIILIFLVILTILLSALYDEIGITLLEYFKNLNPNYVTMISICLGSILVIIFAIIHIRFVEKTITNPIYGLIDALKNYGKEKQIEQAKILEFKEYLEKNDDISRLIKSFSSLNKNIEENLNKIQKATAEKEKIETEFNVASNIQSNMLKTNFNEFSKGKAFEIYGFMKPARKVGGDFYDFFEIDDDNIAFVIGDVSGKGIPATVFMVKTMHLIRNHSKFKKNPKEIFENVNNISCQRNEEELFVTSWFGKLNLKTGKMVFVNAEHNPPLIKQNTGNTGADESDFEYLNIPPNFVLGGMEGLPYKQHELCLNHGDIIFLYTDGITEANNNYQGFYGEDRLKKIISKHKDKNLDEIIEKIRNDVYSFCDESNQFDDMTMLIIKYTGGE